MLPSYAAPTPLEYFAALVQSDDEFPLFEAAASIAQDESPDLDLQQLQSDMDLLQARLRRRLGRNLREMPELERLHALNQFFFSDLGFAGNVNNYYDPDNSYLSEVLRTRRGIPLTLGLLWMELAQGLRLKAHGVGFPGHFMVKVNLPKGQVVIDPFTGHSLSREALSERLEPFQPRQLQGVLADDADVPLGLYLQTAAPRDIVARMLRNLKEIHRSQQDWGRLIAVQDRLIVLLPESWAEYRDRGQAYATQGHTAQALTDLETYLHHAAFEALDIGTIADQVDALRRKGD